MFPFVAPNPEGLEQRTLAQDDIAGISSYYPSASFDANFGSISGTVRKGGFPHLGAHIWAVTNDDRSVVVGVLSDESGAYCLQGLPPGDYILRVEPICVQKERVNEILATKEHGQLVNFMAQIYNDVNSEDSATLIAVSAPGYVSPIDFALVNSSEDVFEDDDSRAEARLLVPSGNRELHNFYPKGESDWYRFDVVEAATYRILISNIGVEFEDPFMTLLDESGSTAVNKNDDLFTAGAYYGPCILFTAEETGTYFVDVRGSRWGTEGYARQYDISLTELDPCHAYVDANNGSDEFGDGTREHPWATIQYAIDSVNGTLNKPQFIHVAEGTYYENIVCDPFEWLYGGYEPVTWERDTSSHTATINGMGIASVIRTANMTEIDGFLITGGSSTNGGGISCQPGTVVNIVGNSIFDNHASGNGGGIFLDDYSGGFIERNSITGNTAAEGAGLYSRWGRRGLTISDGVFRDNHASGLGGGAHFGWGPYDDLDILRNRFLGNSGSAGGAIGLRVDLLDTEIRDNLFVQNCASGLGSGYRGGAIYFSEHSRAYILNNLFCQNGSSGMDGGALGLMGVGGSITGNIFVGNSGRLGGVLYYYIASPLITNNIMAGNEARVSGGAICFSSLVRSHIANNTIVQNKAGTFGGAFAFAALSNNEPYIVNNTIAYNSPDSVYENTDDSDPDFLYNNLPTTSTVLYYDHDTATYYYTANEINEDVNNPGKTVANNVGWDPGFKPAPGGMADTIIYDSNTYQSVLTDSNASFEPNALATLTINPDINQPLHFYIISNTQTSVRTWGDMNSVAMPPCTYQVFDYHLAKDSNNIDAGMDVSEYVNTDIDGDPRPLDDGFDIGADEVSLLANTCWDPAECAGQTSGDATCDGNINLADLFALKAHFGKSAPWTPPECCADFTQDGSINLADLFALKAGFGTSGYSPSTGNQDCPP
jgi:parallel beta-helix repeat protein